MLPNSWGALIPSGDRIIPLEPGPAYRRAEHARHGKKPLSCHYVAARLASWAAYAPAVS